MTDVLDRPREGLDVIAARIRAHVVDMCALPEGGHLGGAFSCVELLTALYFAVLQVDPKRPNDPERDRFLLSKGHAALGLYATLAERGFFSTRELAGFGQPSGRLMAHPVRTVPGVELPTGSLGHGLALACGFALAARQDRKMWRSYVLMGDGELQEGSVWEAAIAAAALRLDRLVAIIDRNGLQLTGATDAIASLEPLGDKWRAFGWAVREVDGHDVSALVSLLNSVPFEAGRPSLVIARTTKGYGLPFLAGRVSSHFVTLTPALHDRARQALSSGSEP